MNREETRDGNLFIRLWLFNLGESNSLILAKSKLQRSFHYFFIFLDAINYK